MAPDSCSHHATLGNLEYRGGGDIITLTANEYLALSLGRRLGYRLYRNPLVMFGIMPAYLFLVHHCLPLGLMRAGWEPWLSAMGTNVAIAAVVMTMIWLVGIGQFLLAEGPVVLIAASLAVWFFYIQHQFEDTRWRREGDWNIHDAALHGSSHYELPPILAWFTGNIGVHRLHHLCSRIPFYRLGQILREHPEFADVGRRLTFVQSLRCATLALWDEEQARLISFQELRTRSTTGRPLSGVARPTGSARRSKPLSAYSPPAGVALCGPSRLQTRSPELALIRHCMTGEERPLLARKQTSHGGHEAALVG